MEYITTSPEETIQVGRDFGKNLQENSVVCFFGDLAAGKTTFIKGLAEGAAGYSQEDVNSPTFVFLNIYEGKRVVYHFDLYRMRGADDFLGMGFDEYLSCGGVSCLEWSERIDTLLPSDCYRVEMSHMEQNKRHITITSP